MVRKSARSQSARFQRARRKAFRNALLSFLARQPNRLVAWEEAGRKLGSGEEAYRGLRRVPVERIVGSVGRYEDFDRAFMPAHDSLKQRWDAVAQARDEAGGMPPIRLYQAGDVYFVLDGHHRLSVAREAGDSFIDAEVTEVETRVPVTGNLDADQIEIKGEYLRFLERTGLDRLRPEQHIEFTIGGGYEQLLDQIAVHQRSMNEEHGARVSPDEAVGDWYDRRYLPLVRIIGNNGILADFPHRTEADLYLWISDHERDLREQCGPGVEIERAAQHFADRHRRRGVKRMVSAVREALSDSTCELVTGQAAATPGVEGTESE